MLKNRKVRISFILVFALIVFVLVSIFIIQPRTTVENELTDRAIEYLGRGKGDFENLNLTPKVLNSNQQIKVPGCYSFTFPFNLTTTREQETCSWIYNFTDPIGRAVVRLKEINVSNLSDVSDVRIRETKTEEYDKSIESINGVEYYIFERSTEGYELSAFALFDTKALSVSITSAINRGFRDEMEELLESLEVEY